MTPPTNTTSGGSRLRHSLLVLSAALVLLGGCASVPDSVPKAQTHPGVATPSSPEPAAQPLDAAAVPAPASTAGDPLPWDPANNAPLVARGKLDPLTDSERSDLWLRVRGGFAITDLDTDLVRKWEQWYARDPAYVQRMTERGGRYLFHIMEEVQRRRLPAELALLPFIESAFNPQAMSSAKASGMWQFMPATGKDFDLRQNIFRDDRRDVLESTRAALDYLKRLHGLFGDWHLALAAYNWGQGNVTRAIERNRRAGQPTDYESLRMPQETREYVPKLQAVKNIVLQPQRFGLSLPPFENHPFFLSVSIERDIDAAVASRLAGLSLEEFQQLNPQMNKPVILAAGTPRLLLPYENANQFLQNLGKHQGPLATWTAWVAPRNLKPAEAAALTGMPEAQLREVNRIPQRMVVKAGSTLLVPRAAHTTHDVAEHLADNATMQLASEARPLRQLSFKVGKQGMTVAAVARRYRVSPSAVARWNRTSVNASFKPGQAVTVMLPAGKATVVAKAAKPALRSATGGRPTKAAVAASKSLASKSPAKPIKSASTGSSAGKEPVKSGGKSVALRAEVKASPAR